MTNRFFLQLKKELPRVKKNVLMKNHTTFRIGGAAEYFLSAVKETEILHAIKVAKRLKIPIFVMGGGSNLLVLDKGIRGLVIKNEVKKPMVLKKSGVVEAPAGIVLETVV